MAEGRMLKKKIATSRRLAELKTDSARLLWTWLLPFLDVEGRYHASPEIIKGTIFPRISFFTTRKIKTCLENLEQVGLISIYSVNGDQFLEFSNFKDNQTLRLDREKPSSIPAKPQIPEQLPDNSRSTPAEVKLNQVKVNQAKVPLKKERGVFLPSDVGEGKERLMEKDISCTNSLAADIDANAKFILNHMNKLSGQNFTDYLNIRNRLSEGAPTETVIEMINNLWKQEIYQELPWNLNPDKIFNKFEFRVHLREVDEKLWDKLN